MHAIHDGEEITSALGNRVPLRLLRLQESEEAEKNAIAARQISAGAPAVSENNPTLFPSLHSRASPSTLTEYLHKSDFG
jgi:hypothetical protein